MRHEIAAEILQQAGIDRVGLAEAGDDDAADRQIGRADDRQQLVLLAVKARRRGDRPGDGAAGRFVEPAAPARVNTRSSHAPTTTAPDRGSANSAKSIFIGQPCASE